MIEVSVEPSSPVVVEVDVPGHAGQPSADMDQFGSASATVNLVNKVAGTLAWDRENKRPVWAVGPAPTDEWVWADGTTAYAPV